MREFPHHYTATAAVVPHNGVVLHSEGLTPLMTDAPVEFDGPGDRWSPETLLTAAIADCFALTFRGVAKYAKLPWIALACRVTGTLDRVDRVTQFTAFTVHASLQLPVNANIDQAERLLERSEQACLISNSLKGRVSLETKIDTVPDVKAA